MAQVLPPEMTALLAALTDEQLEEWVLLGTEEMKRRRQALQRAMQPRLTVVNR